MVTIHPLKAYRGRQDPPLSQEQLAELLGVSRTTVARWETGMRKLDGKLLRRVSKVTGIPPTKLRTDLVVLLGVAG